jgi:hypothetical protein
MNIFYLSPKPEEAAQMACDKHVIKMILESTQLLYTAQWLSEENSLDKNELTSYKVTHKNHPSAIWTRSSIHHYNWLCQLALAYCEEYKHRYEVPGKPKEHACKKHLDFLYTNPPKLSENEFIQPPQCMPDIYKNESSVIAYRQYYIGEKMDFVRYTRREAPEWIIQYLKK